MATILQFSRRATVAQTVSYLNMAIAALAWGAVVILGIVCIFYGSILAMRIYHFLHG